MLSPFPGMDPYLEGPEWTSLHFELSSEIERQLSPQLRPKYVARAVRRFVTDMPDDVAITADNFYPDMGVLTVPRAVKEIAATTPPPLLLETVIPARVPHVTIEIREARQRKLVTAIEVLSPTNKRGQGYREYLEKRRRLLQSTAHLLEVDLLRAGRRVPMQKPLPSAPYFVFLSRAERRPIIETWPIQFEMRLPAIPVPLLAGDHDATLDLQAAFDTVYDTLNYDLEIDYARLPEPPLNDGTAAWANARIRSWLAARESPSSPLDLKT